MKPDISTEQLLEKFHGEWGGDVSRVYEEMSF